MVNSRKEGKSVIEQLVTTFSHFNKTLYCSFGDFCEKVTIKDIRQVSLQELQVKPDKRVRDGKDYTPSVGIIDCEECSLLFVLEDITVVITLDGIRLEMGDTVRVLFSTAEPKKKVKRA